MNWWEGESEPIDKLLPQWWEAGSEPAQMPPLAPAPTGRKAARSGDRRPYAARVSHAAGYPVSDKSDLPWGQRALLGLADTFEEKQAEFLRMYPAGTLNQVQLPHTTELVYSRGPTDQPRLLDEPGVTMGDVADRPQSLLEMPLQAAAAIGGPPGWLANATLQALIPGGVHLAKEGIQEMRGAQQEPWTNVVARAGVESAADFVLGAPVAGLTQVIKGPVHTGAQQLVDDYNAIKALQELENVADPFAYQLRPDKAIMKGAAQQGRSTSAAMQQAEMNQQLDFGGVISRLRDTPVSHTGVVLTTRGARAIKKAKDQIQNAFRVDPEEAGMAIKGIFTKTFARKSRDAINNAYADAGASAKGVTFDLTGAQRAAVEVTAPVDATATRMIDSEILDLTGRPLTQKTIQEFVNVAADPGSKVSRVGRLLATIDPQQANWEVVKELRSQVGDVIATLPSAEDAVSGRAKTLWRELTRVIENPVGGNPAFVSKWKTANALARKRFEVYEQGKVLGILSEDSPARIANLIGDDPTVLTPIIRDVIRDYAPAQIATIRKGVQTRILSDPNGAMAGVDAWKRANPDAYRFMFPTKAVESEFKSAARAMDKLSRSPVQQMLDNTGAMMDKGKVLLSRMGPHEVAATMKLYGGKQSHGGQAIRLAAFDDVIGKSFAINKEGIPTLDMGALNKAITDARRAGIWDNVFTAEDKIRIKGFDAYVRRVFGSMGDVGASLEKQQAIASLKHPSTIMNGIHALAVNNRIIAPLMMSPTAARLFRPVVKKRGRNRIRITEPGTWAFVANVMGEVSRLSKDEAFRTEFEGEIQNQ